MRHEGTLSRAVFTPREHGSSCVVFNCELRKLPDDWVRRPSTLTLAGIRFRLGDANLMTTSTGGLRLVINSVI